MTGRVCHAIEIAPAYVDVAVKRWQEFTGQQAVLDGDKLVWASRPEERWRRFSSRGSCSLAQLGDASANSNTTRDGTT